MSTESTVNGVYFRKKAAGQSSSSPADETDFVTVTENSPQPSELQILREENSQLKHEIYLMGLKLKSVKAKTMIYCIMICMGFVIIAAVIQSYNKCD